MKHALTFVLATTCFSAWAGKWVEVQNASAAAKVSVDVSSLQTVPNKRTVWTRFDFKTPQQNPNDPKKIMQSMLSKQQFDCAKETVQALQIIMYSPSGEVVGQHTQPDPVQHVEPNTTMDELFEFVCSPRVKSSG